LQTLNLIFLTEGITRSGWVTIHGRDKKVQINTTNDATKGFVFIVLNDETNVLSDRPFSEAERAPAGAVLE
jgi:hypothetical protein